MSDVSIEVRGLEEVQRKLEQVVKDLRGRPMVEGMREATLMVQRDAKLNAPVKTGRLQASITPQVQVSGARGGQRIQGIVGSNVVYAPYQEERTTMQAGRRGGGYLRRAFEANRDRIVRLLGKVVAHIVRK